ncbi:MAG: glycosyltransferase [Nonlabens sp.]|uniref:glycosyltransferase family 4 protein n=2 Tax=Nonlabens sp. TaxID=1888209 RepID=UPI00321A2310
MKKLLVIGKNWPEPKTTAAGYRMLQLLEIFKENSYSVHFCSATQKSKYSFDLESIGIKEQTVFLNDDSFDTYIQNLQPDIVLYDRFMTEEQYSWRVRENSSTCIHILDTEDLHFLRKAREVVLKKKQPLNLYNEVAMREIASISRCDLSMIISTIEFDLLQKDFEIPKSKLVYIPFLYSDAKREKLTFNQNSFQKRSNFVMIGNSLHEPNYDAILYMKKEIWPLIRKTLPQVEVHIYGAYQSDKITQLHNKKDGFLIKGFASDAYETLANYRILLAPLRFGAGLKGKIFDALHTATPVAMTSIAAEAMFVNSAPFGFIEDEMINYATYCVELYQSKEQWNEVSGKHLEILKSNYDRSAFAKALLLQISKIDIKSDEQQSPLEHFNLKMLNYHSNARFKYLSKWIALKNSNQA